MSLWDIATGIVDLITLPWANRKADAGARDAAREAYKTTEEGKKLRALEEKLKELDAVQRPEKRIQNHQPDEME